MLFLANSNCGKGFLFGPSRAFPVTRYVYHEDRLAAAMNGTPSVIIQMKMITNIFICPMKAPTVGGSSLYSPVKPVLTPQAQLNPTFSK